VLSELEKHFTDNKWNSARYFLKDTTKYGKSVTVIIDNNAYLQDLQNAKTRMSEMEHKYMTDFVSDVEENLSFVVQIYGSDE
jgi:phosphopantetheine adenylyltransferase